MPEQDDAKTEDPRMALWEHLDELRSALVRSLVVILVGLVVTYNFSAEIVSFLERPLLQLLPEGQKVLYFTGITDKFMVYFKVSVLASVVLTSPILLYQVWGFIAPALYQREKKFLAPFLLLGSASFFSGLAFAFFVLIPVGYEFLIQFGSPNEQAMITITEYFDLTIKLMLAMGLLFELPVVTMLLGWMGIVSSAGLRKFRRHAFLVNAVVSGIATPTPDVFTMALMMVPLFLLYEIGILAVSSIERVRA